MTKIDIVSGFLGAGKTTLIKKLLKEALNGTRVVLIENEFGQIGIDGGFLKDSGIEIREMNSGCICCSLVGDFGSSLQEVLSAYQPERILIEPSGVGKLSDVMKAVKGVKTENEVQLNSAVAVVDAAKCKMYINNFGEFFINQITYAGTIILSRTGNMKEEKIKEAVELIRQYNQTATIITTPWGELNGQQILETIEDAKKLEADLMEEVMKLKDEHEHHHDDEDEHEHHHDDEEEEHDHHHHDEEEHDHHHHDGHHHADEVFDSWGLETPNTYTADEIAGFLKELDQQEKYGLVLRAKGMVPSPDGKWTYFDFVPGESNIREGAPDVTGKFCVIGAKINEKRLEQLFSK